MNKYNYYRRSSIEKFNNRPPFDIKKMDYATSTENRDQGTPPCKHCEKKYTTTTSQSYINVVKYLEHFGDKCKNSPSKKNQNVIPKIIESFQKVNPKKSSKGIRYKSKSESLETLYRNSSLTFGKNLPNHKLMKNLLKNFKEGVNEPVQYQQIDMIPSKDTDAIFSQNTSENKIAIRVDRKTSTTGLQWPLVQDEHFQVNLEPSENYGTNNNSGKIKSKIPQRKEFCKLHHTQFKCDRKKSSDSSDLEYFPTKENILKKPDLSSKMPMVNNLINVVVDKFPKYKYPIKHENYKKEGTYILHAEDSRHSDVNMEPPKKEKSFVQSQVEKLNKKSNKKHVYSRGQSSNNTLKTKDLKLKNKNMNKRYISLMTSVKETLPKILVDHPNSGSENHEWSDNQVNTNIPVQFPKETRNAMENLLKNLRKMPLAKYAKKLDQHIQPAIQNKPSVDSREINKTYSGMCHKKVSHMQCPRNVLHQKGNHDRPETVPLPRYGEGLRINAIK